MTVSSYLRGSKIRLEVDVKNENGGYVDPATLSLVVKKPDESSETFTLAGGTVLRTALGRFHVDFQVALAGRHFCRWTSTNPGSATERQFVVLQGEFTS